MKVLCVTYRECPYDECPHKVEHEQHEDCGNAGDYPCLATNRHPDGCCRDYWFDKCRPSDQITHTKIYKWERHPECSCLLCKYRLEQIEKNQRGMK